MVFENNFFIFRKNKTRIIPRKQKKKILKNKKWIIFKEYF